MGQPYTEQQLINALRRIEKRWPEGYILFSWSGTLCLMRDGEFPETNSSPCQTAHRFGKSANDAIVAMFNIPNDGGDPVLMFDDVSQAFEDSKEEERW